MLGVCRPLRRSLVEGKRLFTPIRRLFSSDGNGMHLSFSLDSHFLKQYESRPSPFGYAPLGELVFYRTYSRLQEDGTREQWWQTVKRVVEGTYSIQKDHINHHNLGWEEKRGQKSAQQMYDLIYNMKFLPPGTSLLPSSFDYIHSSLSFGTLADRLEGPSTFHSFSILLSIIPFSLKK